MIRNLRLLRAIGQFESVDSAATIDLSKLTLVYADNARGKTTVAAVLRSLANGEVISINERRRLGTTLLPEAIVDCSGATSPACFQNGAWSRTCPEILVFDDVFVDRNVYSGMEVDAEHRQNLHDLILGERGVALAQRVDELAARIRSLATELRTRANAIPADDRHGLNVDEFCALAPRNGIDAAITAAEQRLAALQNADLVRSTPEFVDLSLPAIDFRAISGLLARGITDLDQHAVQAVTDHFAELGDGAEAWVATGMLLGAQNAQLTSEDDCPFCKQPLSGSAIFERYRAYFGQAYTHLQAELTSSQARLETTLSGDALAGFERQVRSAEERRQFWSRVTAIPNVTINSTDIAAAWQRVRDAAIAAVRTKRSDPLTPIDLSVETQLLISKYGEVVAEVAAYSAALQAANEAVQRAKESVQTGNVATAQSELNRLNATKARQSPANMQLCDEYLAEKAAKEAAEDEKARAQQELEHHRATAFPNWHTAINTYLSRLGAGFTIASIQAQPTGGRPSCVYRLVINGQEVAVGAGTAPAGNATFKNTLSSGDRNTLALAFFLASLDQDPNRGNRVVVLDDPMSSLDKHRRMNTIQEIRTLLPAVEQLIVMSHDEYFLFEIYDRVAPRNAGALTDTTVLHVRRSTVGSTIDVWDIESEKMSRHDKRQSLLARFASGEGGDPLTVAQSIRPHLEHFLRAACPQHFRASETLREFRNRARSARQTGHPIISDAKLSELDQLVDYSNDFHHDTNPAADTVVINDTQLRNYVQRTVGFISL